MHQAYLEHEDAHDIGTFCSTQALKEILRPKRLGGNHSVNRIADDMNVINYFLPHTGAFQSR
jgi:hypothetical protein